MWNMFIQCVYYSVMVLRVGVLAPPRAPLLLLGTIYFVHNTLYLVSDGYCTCIEARVLTDRYHAICTKNVHVYRTYCDMLFFAILQWYKRKRRTNIKVCVYICVPVCYCVMFCLYIPYTCMNSVNLYFLYSGYLNLRSTGLST